MFACSIEKEEPVGPTYLHLEDADGNVVTSIYFIYGIPSPTYYVKTDATPVVLSVYPSMPYGISFHSSKGELRGTPREYFPETTMTFTARNMIGNITSTIQLSVGDCQFGLLVTPHFITSGSGIMTLQSEGITYYNHTLGTDDPLRHVICLPPLLYNYSFTCESRLLPCELYLADNMSNYYLGLYVLFGDTKSGSFELKPTHKPSLDVSLLTAYTKEVLMYSLRADGIHGNITVNPELPVGLEIDSRSALIKGHAPSPMLQKYNLTVSNEVGSTTTEFTLAVDMCPTGLDPIMVRKRYLSNGETWTIRDGQGKPLVDNTGYFSLKHLFCLTPDTFQIDMATTLSSSERKSRTALVLSDPKGVLAEFWIPSDASEATRHFAYAYSLPSQSEWKVMRGSVDGKWTCVKFNDKKWESGKFDSWGSFSKDVSSLFLRRSFSVDASKFTFVNVDVERSADCDLVLYLNEREFGRLSGSKTSSRFSLPVSFVASSSVLAVEIHRAAGANETAPIVFDARVTSVASSCLLQSVNGEAASYEDGKWSKEFADRAFDLIDTKFWTAHSFPSLLRYSFKDASVVVNRVLINAAGGDLPRSVRVEGVTADNTTVALFSVDSPVLLHSGMELFDFPNSQAFPIYQFIFDGPQKEVFFTVADARLYECTDRQCKKRMGLKAAGIDVVVDKKCPFLSVGVRQMRCVEKDNAVEWVDDRSACGKWLPSQRVAYVDWTFELTNVTTPQWNATKNKLNAMFTDELKVAPREVAYLLVRDVSVDVVKLRVMTRFTLEVEIGDYVYKHLKELKQVFSEHVSTVLQRSDVEASVVDMRLREPINIGSIVLVCMTAVVILLMVLFVQFLKRRMTSAKSRKSLRHLRKGGDDASLLSESVLSVCCE